MKIKLTKLIPTEVRGKECRQLGELLEKAVFESMPGTIHRPKDLYDKIKGQKEVDLTVEELSALKKAVNALYIAGVAWLIEDVLEGRENGS